ncbi:glucoamylase family protein [Cupriavidus campinensis]
MKTRLFRRTDSHLSRQRPVRRALCIALGALLIASCGGDDTDTPPPADTPSEAPHPDNVTPAPPAPVPEPPPPPIPPAPPSPPSTDDGADPEDTPAQPDPQAALKAQAREYASALWKSIEAMETRPMFPANKACLNNSGVLNPVNWMFVGELGMYIMNVTAARDLGMITPEDAHRRMAAMLPKMAALQAEARTRGAPGGLFLGSANSTTGVPGSDVGVVENAWVAAALALAKQAYPELAAQSGAILAQMRFDTMLDQTKQQYHINYNPATGQHSTATYGLLGETRLIAYAGIALGQVPRSQYFHIGRVPTWAERTVDPAKFRTYEGVSVYEGTRSYQGQHFMATLGGSVFEAFSVPILISEQKWGVNSWARSHPNLAKAHVRYGHESIPGGYWGFSPATIPANNGYTEYGAPPLSLGGGYRSEGQRVDTRAGPVVSLFSVFMLMEYEPEAAMANMRKLLETFPALNHPTYGFMDSVDVVNGTVAKCMIYGDNSLALGAIANYLTNGKLRGYVDKEWGHALQPLLAIEEFSIPAQP